MFYSPRAKRGRCTLDEARPRLPLRSAGSSLDPVRNLDSPNLVQPHIPIDVIGKVVGVPRLSAVCHGQVRSQRLELVLVRLHLDDAPAGRHVRAEDHIVLSCGMSARLGTTEAQNVLGRIGQGVRKGESGGFDIPTMPNAHSMLVCGKQRVYQRVYQRVKIPRSRRSVDFGV